MRNVTRVSILTICLFLTVLASPMVQSAVTRAQEQQSTQTIDVTAKKYEFDPPVIHVKAGTTVVLKITATDHAHGFGISTVADGAAKDSAPGIVLTSPPTKDCYRIEKGQQQSVQIEAKTAGTYKFKCCVHCGMGHLKMKGEVIVDP